MEIKEYVTYRLQVNKLSSREIYLSYVKNVDRFLNLHQMCLSAIFTAIWMNCKITDLKFCKNCVLSKSKKCFAGVLSMMSRFRQGQNILLGYGYF